MLCCSSKGNGGPKNIRSGTIHKMTLVVRDTNESEAFAVDVLGCERIVCPDKALHARGIRWVRLPGKSQKNHEYNGELHFIPISEGTPEQRRHWLEHKRFMDAQDRDMQMWACAMNTHVGFSVDDLSPIVAKLQQRRQPFFGPTLRADGVYQLYVELPYHHYIEIDSRVYDERLKRSMSWKECAARGGVDREDWEGEDLSQTKHAAMQGNRQKWTNLSAFQQKLKNNNNGMGGRANTFPMMGQNNNNQFNPQMQMMNNERKPLMNNFQQNSQMPLASPTMQGMNGYNRAG